jgi:outer membrane biogenesis lipoprotein LolB
MQNNTATLSQRVLVTLACALLFLSGCTLTNSISQGNLDNGVYD